MLHLSAALLAAGLLFSLPAPEDDGWKRFRGPNGSGVIAAEAMPAKLVPEENARWRTPLKPGFSSPVLSAKHIFVTAHEGTKLYTVCIDRESGKVVWETEAPKELKRPSRGPNSPVSSTPVTDGENVYVFFGNYGLVSYDAAGKERWKQPLGPFKNPYGMANSPILVDELLVLQADQDSGSYLLALDRDSGEKRWQVERPTANTGFSTPIIHRPSEGAPEIIVLGSFELCGYSAATAEKLWHLPGMAWQSKSVPVVDGGTLYVHSWMASCKEIGLEMTAVDPWKEVLSAQDLDGDGKLSKSESPDPGMSKYWFLYDLDKDGFIDAPEWGNLAERMKASNGLYRVKLGGTGDLRSAVEWHYERGLQNVPSPLLYDDVLYMLKEGGVLTAIDPEKGTALKRARLCEQPDLYYASPVAADGKIYTASHSGLVVVLEAGREWKTLHTQDFDEEIWATPALAPGRVYLRTEKALYCFE